jgi:hypothetical protein
MSGMPLLRRRKILGALGCVAVAICSAVPWASSRSENAPDRMVQKLVSLLPDQQRARQVGTVYLQSSLGQSAPPLALVETVLAAMGPNASSKAIRQYLIARIQQELQDVQVVSVDGWIMSPTEAQLCALSAAV